jgi:hypothetical protein
MLHGHLQKQRTLPIVKRLGNPVPKMWYREYYKREKGPQDFSCGQNPIPPELGYAKDAKIFA